MDKALINKLILLFALAAIPSGAISPKAILAHKTAGGAICGSYVHYRVITVPAQSGLSGNLSNYPLLVSGTYFYLATVANGGLVQNASGFDVGFFTDNTCATKLPWETETYSATAGTVNYWVKVPTISQSSSITFVMAYDSASITTDQSNKTGTWDANFWAVYHVPNGTTLTTSDSTSNGNNGLINGGITAATGQIDGAANFAGGAYISKTSPANQPLGNAARTMSSWVKFATVPAGIQVTNFFGADNGNKGAYGMYLNGATLTSEFGSSAGALTGGTLSASTWYYLTATYTGSTTALYVNGTSVGSGAYSLANAVTGEVDFGEGFGCCAVSAGTLIDEARFSNVARSADWLKTDYNSQSSPSTFYSVGSQF